MTKTAHLILKGKMMRSKSWAKLFDEMDKRINRKVERAMEGFVTSMNFAEVQQEAANLAAEQKIPDGDIALNKRAQILRKAEELINGDRAQTYGPPEISFSRIADIWNAMGYRRHVPIQQEATDSTPIGVTRSAKTVYKAEKLDAIDAAHMLIGMKLSRSVGGHGVSVDDWVDLAGYSGLGAELATPNEAEEDPTPVAFTRDNRVKSFPLK